MSVPVREAIAERLLAVRSRIATACERAGRDPATVTLIGVTKTHGAETVVEAVRAGLRDVGENRVQEAVPKAEAVAALGERPTWHMVGHLQRNKVRAALGTFAILHGVDSERLLRAIDRAAETPARVFLEVNVAGEATKHGAAPDALAGLVSLARTLPNVELEGLMTVAPRVDDPEEARPVFRALRELAERHDLRGLSMGMTDDFEVAIAEGATHVRIGRAILGERAQ